MIPTLLTGVAANRGRMALFLVIAGVHELAFPQRLKADVELLPFICAMIPTFHAVGTARQLRHGLGTHPDEDDYRKHP